MQSNFGWYCAAQKWVCVCASNETTRLCLVQLLATQLAHLGILYNCGSHPPGGLSKSPVYITPVYTESFSGNLDWVSYVTERREPLKPVQDINCSLPRRPNLSVDTFRVSVSLSFNFRLICQFEFFLSCSWQLHKASYPCDVLFNVPRVFFGHSLRSLWCQ